MLQNNIYEEVNKLKVLSKNDTVEVILTLNSDGVHLTRINFFKEEDEINPAISKKEILKDRGTYFG